MIEKGKLEYNLNTYVLVGGILLGCVSTGVTWGVFAARLENADQKTEQWQQRHEQLHRDRLASTTATDARVDQRLAQLDVEARKIDNLTYRITIAEQAGANAAKQLERLNESVNQQSADLRVMREIIERQFGASQRTTR